MPAEYLKKAFKHEIVRQFITFASVGVIGTLVHYATLVALVQICRVHPVIASGAGFVGGAVTNYKLNYHITFKSSKQHKEAFVKFFLVALIGLSFNSLVMVFCIEMIKLHYFISQVCATGIVLIWNYSWK